MLCRLLCLLLFLGLTAERSGDPLLFNGTWRSPLSVFSPLFDSLPGVRQPAWNLILVALAPLCFLRPGAFRKRALPMDAAILLSLATIAVSALWGIARGGSGYWAYYQVNALVWALFVALLLTSVLRSPADVKLLWVTILAAALLRASLALYYFFAFVRGREPYPPHMTSHEDSPLFAAGVLILLAWALVRWRWKTWVTVAMLVVPILLAMKVNNRRLVWFEVALAVAFIYPLLPTGRLRRNVSKGTLVAAPLLAVYVLVGWGRPGPVFAPLRAFDSTTGENQDASSLARNEENLNLMLTYIQHPLVGSGWGQQFLLVSGYYAHFGGGFDEMYRYTPHNSLAALIAFTGLVGLFGTLLILPVASFLAARGHRRGRDPTVRTATMVAVCMLPAYGVHAYADIGLQSMTAGLLLSAVMATANRGAAWTGAWPTSRGRRRRTLESGRPRLASRGSSDSTEKNAAVPDRSRSAGPGVAR